MMRDFQLIVRNLFFFRRTNFAILLGVMAGTAVITGALVVGDSVRMSLYQLTLRRLGSVSHALTGPRFFREELAADLARVMAEDEKTKVGRVAPLLIFSGGLQTPEGGDGPLVRANRVQIYGVDERAWGFLKTGGSAPPSNDEVLLNTRVAEQLGVKAGGDLVLNLSLPAAVPRDSLLGKKDSTTTQVPLKVREILPDSVGASRLGLRPDQQIPLNAFVSLKTLQEALELQQKRPSAEEPRGKPARVNTLFVNAIPFRSHAEALNGLLPRVLQLGDLDLRLVEQPARNYFAVESERMILENSLADTATKLADEQQEKVIPSLVYLANKIHSGHGEKAYSMYSTVAGLPLDGGYFSAADFVGAAPTFPLKEDEVLINSWLAEDLQAKVGEKISLDYFTAGSRGELPETTKSFRVAGILKLEGGRGGDPGLVPMVKGITTAKTLRDWDQPFDMRFDLITKRDEDYWEKYRATPKVFMPLKVSQDLWRTRYGELTSLLVTPPNGAVLKTARDDFGKKLLPMLPLADLGMAFQPVAAIGTQAAMGTTDFGGLFFGFSLFLILSAAILVGLLFRLGIERRLAEIGLLEGVGFTRKRIRKVILAEGSLVMGIGTILGIIAGVFYAWLMLWGLTTLWVGAIRTRDLELSVDGKSLILGGVISFVVAIISIVTSLRRYRQTSVRQLLSGRVETVLTDQQRRRVLRRAAFMATVTLGIAGVLIAGNLFHLFPQEPAAGGMSWQVLTFFPAGMLLLTGAQFLLSWWLLSDRGTAVWGQGNPALARLAVRNGARSRSRTVLTVGLLGSATFLVVAVAAGQRNPARETPEKYSGNGGFMLVAESDSPLLFDLNTHQGRVKYSLSDPAATRTLDKSLIVPFRMRSGDNASCLNLYQTQLPTILGVPRQMIERGGFRFVDGVGKNPWEVLETKPADGSIPVLGDMNTLMFSMHKGVGDVIPVDPKTPERGRLKISGMFDGAVFQGVLLMSEENFLKVFPNQAGFQYFLVDCPPSEATAVTELLESRLSPFGFDAEKVADRLADFLSVQNTYLSTFQTLGGLGLLLGTFGLGTVMLRNVLERRGEMALLLAVGFLPSQLTRLILFETAVLLVWGLVAGTVSALLSMGPHLASIGADVPWISGSLTLLAIFVAGLGSAWGALRSVRGLPLLETLRTEQP